MRTQPRPSAVRRPSTHRCWLPASNIDRAGTSYQRAAELFEEASRPPAYLGPWTDELASPQRLPLSVSVPPKQKDRRNAPLAFSLDQGTHRELQILNHRSRRAATRK